MLQAWSKLSINMSTSAKLAMNGPVKQINTPRTQPQPQPQPQPAPQTNTSIISADIDVSQLKIFVIHYKKLTDRKKNIMEQFKKYGITNFEFIEIDRDRLHEHDTSMFNPNWNNGQIAIALSHFYAYSQISENFDNALILEDDVIFSHNFKNIFQKYTTQLPVNYDMLFIGDGCDLHISSRHLVHGKFIYKKTLHDGASRCSDSYLVSKKCATQLCNYIKKLPYKIKIPIDWWLNQAAFHNNFNVYWSEPTIATQGTQNGTYKTSLPDYYFEKKNQNPFHLNDSLIKT